MKVLPLLAAAALLSASPMALAAAPGFDTAVNDLAVGWAHANFELHDRAARINASDRLVQEAESLARDNPSRAEPLVWEAIVLSTEAGVKGGLDGLGLVKRARALLERAERLNPNALGDGSIYTTLGSLYAQVPGFPIGFGDARKARTYLEKGLSQNPDGIDPNYFYADFLARQGDRTGAIRHLERALAAPPRPGREVADRGRRAEARALLEKLRQER